MARDFASLLASGAQKSEIRLGSETAEVRLMSAYEAVLCKSEAERLLGSRFEAGQLFTHVTAKRLQHMGIKPRHRDFWLFDDRVL